MVGRETLGGAASAARGGREAVLSVRGLTLDVPTRHGWRRVLDGVGFDLHRGEVLGIAGLLGSGRTEILETIFGSAPGRRGGVVALDGVPVASPRPATPGGSGSRSSPRTARRPACTSAPRPRQRRAALARPPRPLRRAVVRRRGAAGARGGRPAGVRCTGIDQVAATLSGGNQQKVVIGKWLATRPARAAARRAHPRHRRRRQAGDLRPRRARSPARGWRS